VIKREKIPVTGHANTKIDWYTERIRKGILKKDFIDYSRQNILHTILETKSKDNADLVIFDVGSHQGESVQQFCISLLESREIKDIEFHCFEPLEINVNAILRAGVYSNVRAYVINAPVSDKNGIVTFKTSRSDTSSIENHNKKLFDTDSGRLKYEPREITKIPAITLDKYIEEYSIAHIDYLKIDAENHEDKVLIGAKKALKNNIIEYVEVEASCGNFYERKVNIYDLEKNLIPYGYELVGINGSHRPECKKNLIYEKYGCHGGSIELIYKRT